VVKIMTGTMATSPVHDTAPDSATAETTQDADQARCEGCRWTGPVEDFSEHVSGSGPQGTGCPDYRKLYKEDPINPLLDGRKSWLHSKETQDAQPRTGIIHNGANPDIRGGDRPALDPVTPAEPEPATPASESPSAAEPAEPVGCQEWSYDSEGRHKCKHSAAPGHDRCTQHLHKKQDADRAQRIREGRASPEIEYLPACELVTGVFQPMPELDSQHYQALVADIILTGVRDPIDVTKVEGEDKPVVLDGNTRAKIAKGINMGGLGIKVPVRFVALGDEDPHDYAVRVNSHRRHLTRRQRQDLIREQLELHPGYADSFIARLCGCSDKTVAAARRRSGISEPDPGLRKGVDNKLHPARKPKHQAAGKPPRKGSMAAVRQELEQAKAELQTVTAERDDLDVTVRRLSAFDGRPPPYGPAAEPAAPAAETAQEPAEPGPIPAGPPPGAGSPAEAAQEPQQAAPADATQPCPDCAAKDARIAQLECEAKDAGQHIGRWRGECESWREHDRDAHDGCTGLASVAVAGGD
jgi:hypothetical protein